MTSCCSLLVAALLVVIHLLNRVAVGSLSSDFRELSREEVVNVSGEDPATTTTSPELSRRVKFEAFNRSYDLTLLPSKGLLSPHFSLMVRRGIGNDSQQLATDPQLSRCFYRGLAAAFDLCQGMRGIVTLSATEFLSVEPVVSDRRQKRTLEPGDSPRHLVRHMRWSGPSSNEGYRTQHNKMKRSLPHFSSSSSGSSRYGDSAVLVETAVFVDAFLYNHMARTHFPDGAADQEIQHFVLAMINAVQLLYQDESLGRQVDFQVQRLEMWSRQPAELQPALTSSGTKQGIHDIDRYLHRFCHWQSRENPSGDNNPQHWDHALLLTGLDLFAVGRDGISSHQIVGLAPIGGMCTATSSCTVNEGRHFESVYVVAHEIGHNLGMKHDGHEAGNDCDSSSYLMSPTLGSGKTQWSPCSQQYLHAFLNSMQAGCLRDRSWIDERLDHNATSLLPGQRYTADQQCMLKYGRNSRRAPHRSLNDICRDLRCTEPEKPARSTRQALSSSLTYSTSHPALEGTSCGESMWCRRGRCTSRVRLHQSYDMNAGNMNAIANQPWATVSECASGCLYGVDLTLKTGSMAVTTLVQNCQPNAPCSNIPQVRHETCESSQVCSPFNRTTIQQYSDELCAQAAQQDNSILPRGTQQLSVDAARSCQVWCYLKSGGLMTAAGWVFPDGTRCQTGTSAVRGNFDRSSATLCMTGRCQEFSCNGDSTYQLHEGACRSDEPTESNVIFDYLYGQQSIRSAAPGIIQQQNSKASLYSPIPSPAAFYSTSNRFAVLPEPNITTVNTIGTNVNAPWNAVSSCRSGCLTSSKGLRLVQRSCDSTGCTLAGPSKSVQLCTPSDQECPKYQSVTSFADQVCREQHWMGMHRGVQTDRNCVVNCRDPYTNELTAAEGETGWFPSGTLCDRARSGYCLSGRCVEFDADGIPK